MGARGSTWRASYGIAFIIFAIVSCSLMFGAKLAVASQASDLQGEVSLQGIDPSREGKGSSGAQPQDTKYFTASILADGKEIPCTFKVLTESGSSGTAEISVAANNDRAIDVSTTGALTIPNTVENNGITYRVTAVGDGAFWTCAGITTTGLAENTSVTSVGYRAYSDCTALKDTGLSRNSTVKTLGNLCFVADTSLVSTGLGSNTAITEIPPSAFSYCLSLTDTGLSANTAITKIGATAFAWCDALTSTGLENNRTVSEIEKAAFVYCTALKSGLGNNTATKSGEELFFPAMAACQVKGLASSYIYTGGAIEPSIEVYDAGRKLDPKSYSVSYSGNKDVGTATVTITGAGGPTGNYYYADSFNSRNIYETWSDYGGSLKVSFKIVEPPAAGTSISGATVSGLSNYYGYTGSAVTPKPKVTMNGTALVEGTDYALSYANNVEQGTATLTISGIGLYEGSISKTFQIKSVYPPDNGTANTSGSVVIGVPGRFETTAARGLVDRVNEIRREAYQLGLIDSYTPITWSHSLEYAAQIRAAEASVGGYGMGHDRPNGSDCFTVENAGNYEILAWSGSMSSGLELWYSEKDDYIKYKNGDTSIPYGAIGHYEALINAKYLGMSSFTNAATGAVAQAGCLSGSATPIDTDKYVVGDQDCIQQIYIKKDYLKASVSDAALGVGESANITARLGTTYDGGNYASTSDLIWKSSNPSVATVDGSGKVTGVSKGTSTIGVSLGNWDLGSSKVTVSDRVPPSFVDVNKGDWFYGSVAIAVDNGYMNGYSGAGAGSFGPNDRLTRGQAAVVLFNMSGEPGTGAGGSWNTGFSDVNPRAYYAEAIAWAKRLGVVNGHGGTFDPEGMVTREQFAAMISNYAKIVCGDTTVDGTGTDGLSRFVDGYDVSGFARQAVSWAAEHGVINGANGYFDPQGVVTRAQCAAMATNYQPTRR